jgi:hypothetical protein
LNVKQGDASSTVSWWCVVHVAVLLPLAGWCCSV